MDKVNLAQKFSMFQEYWSPKIVGEVNNSYVKLVKFKGEFVWHLHETEDELFLVVKGNLLDTTARQRYFRKEEFVIIPKGVDISLPMRKRTCCYLSRKRL